MRVSICVLVLAVSVGAHPTRRLRRPGGPILEISSDQRTTASSSGMAFHGAENSFSEMIRLLQESATTTMSVAYSMSMSMASGAPSPTPSVAPAPTLPPITDTPTSNAVVTDAPTTVAPVTVAPTTVVPVTVAPSTMPPTLPPVRPPSAPPTLAPVPVPTSVPTAFPVASSVPSSSLPLTTAPTASVPVTPPSSGDSPSSAPTTFAEYRDQVIEEKCGVTPLERSRDILSILSVISDPVDLITPGSSQFKARDWLDNRDRAVICATEAAHVGQRYRAALLYYALGGPGWANCRAWEDDEEDSTPCLEEDVRTSRRLQEMMKDKSVDWKKDIANYGRRRRPTFQERHVQESSSPAFEEEESVRWLSANNECEWFGMDCGDAYQEGDPTDAYYPLVNIDLGKNNLEGSLIQENFGFVELQALFLDGNSKISGTIPEEIGRMTQLKFLDIDDSEVTGPLPNALYSLSSMLVIDLNANQLTGTLSPAIGNLTGLEILQLENNAMTGVLPTESLLDLTRLVALTVEGNLFTGTLEPLCDVREERRLEYEIYLNFMFAECGGEDPLVECSCCVCY